MAEPKYFDIDVLATNAEKKSAARFLEKTAQLTFAHENRFGIFNTKTNREIEKLLARSEAQPKPFHP